MSGPRSVFVCPFLSLFFSFPLLYSNLPEINTNDPVHAGASPMPVCEMDADPHGADLTRIAHEVSERQTAGRPKNWRSWAIRRRGFPALAKRIAQSIQTFYGHDVPSQPRARQLTPVKLLTTLDPTRPVRPGRPFDPAEPKFHCPVLDRPASSIPLLVDGTVHLHYKNPKTKT